MNFEEAYTTFEKLKQNINPMNSTKDLIGLIDVLISNFDPTPLLVSEEFPLRWEAPIFFGDYDFSENFLDLDQDYERLNGKFLQSVGTAIELVKNENGSYEYWDGIFMIEAHTWCSKLNSTEDFPSFSLINKKFENMNELIVFLKDLYG
jgi:hypothetical protein